MLKSLPKALIIFRFVLGPVILLAYLFNVPPAVYMIILTSGFLSDYFDGVIARKLGVSTRELRSLDSWADTMFYICVFLVALGLYYDRIAEYGILLTVLVLLEIVRHVFDRIKFSKSASYHMWSAKFWGLCLYLAFMQLLGFGETQYLFTLAIVVGIISDVEGLLASIILTSWKADVPSVFHAWRVEASERSES